MLRSSLCDYRDVYILFKGIITVTITAVAAVVASNLNNKVISKNFSQFTNCISGINNTQADDAQYTDVVMSIYNLIEYIMIIIQTHLEFYGNIVEINRL